MIKKFLPGNSSRTSRKLIVQSVLIGSLFGSGLSLAQGDGVKNLSVTVESGDTFSGILSRELDSLDGWSAVANFNDLKSVDSLSPGDVLVIPADVIRRSHYATVAFVKGGVTHVSALNDTRGPLEKGTRLYAGGLIETDENGFVGLAFNGGSTVNIQPKSKMRITRLNCIHTNIPCEIKLQSDEGQLGIDVQNVGFEKPTEFTIDTPFASAAVRGTRYDMTIDDGNVLGVTEGSVEISFNGEQNNIDRGKGVLAGEGRSISRVFDLLAAPAFKLPEEPARISAEDIITWQAVDGTEQYIVTYARNEGLSDVIASNSQVGTSSVPVLSPGARFVAVRSQDENGILGFTNVAQLNSVAIDENSAATDLEVVLSGSRMTISAPGASQAVEVKVGNEVLVIDATEYIVATQTLEVAAGQTVTLEIDEKLDWYLQGRNLVSNNRVSPYGFLYLFDAADQ